MFIPTFSLILAVLAFATYNKALLFTFWKDDWLYFWNSIYSTKILTPILLHPATFVEFQIFSTVFGANVFLWQIFGIFLKIAASLSVALLTWGLTRSKYTTVLSGIFFAVSSSGFEATIWASAHVVNWVILFLCIGTYFGIEYNRTKQKKSLLLFILFTLLGIAADPARGIPIIIIDFIILDPPIVPAISYGFIACAGITIFLWKNIVQTPIARFVIEHYNNPQILFSKLHVIGQFFQSLFNLATSWFLTPSHYINEASHGIYSRLDARFGAVLVVCAFIAIFISWKKNRVRLYPPFIFFLWIILFYLPNWVSEPRIIATGNHRYLTVANVGFVCLVAYAVSHIKPKLLSFIAMIVFIILNVQTTNTRLTELSRYRNKTIVDSVWNQVNIIVRQSNDPKIFVYLGEEPIKTNIFDISQSIPYAVKNHITKYGNFPLVTIDFQKITQLLCATGSPYTFGNLYAFEIKNGGEVRDVSPQIRSRIICPLP